MNFAQWQEEVSAWSRHNFGEQTAERPLLGMIEELGELAHPVLKQAQGIRVNEHRREQVIDAVGDLVIYSLDFCGRAGYDAAEAYQTAWDMRDLLHEFKLTDQFQCMFGAAAAIGKIARLHMRCNADKDNYMITMSHLGLLYIHLQKFCGFMMIDFTDCVAQTWSKVKARDWTQNKVNGQ